MFLMDRFFDGTFLTFGIEVISFAERDQEDRIDPMVMIKIFPYLTKIFHWIFSCFQVYIFPRMTKCTFHKFGTSGEIEKHDAMCILPLNIGNHEITIIDAYSYSQNMNNFSEWENLYFLVVLVPAVGISHLLGVSLQNINCGVSEIKGGWSLWSTQF